jgi:hypothetical protein
MPNRPFGSLIIFFYRVHDGVLSATPQRNVKPNFVPIDVVLLTRFDRTFFHKSLAHSPAQKSAITASSRR